MMLVFSLALLVIFGLTSVGLEKAKQRGVALLFAVATLGASALVVVNATQLI